MPLYLHGDAPLSSLLHLYLTRRVAAMYTRLPGHVDRQSFNGRFRASGFDEPASIWPVDNAGAKTPDRSGHMHLLEYFTFREKFMFAELAGLESVEWPESPEWFELEVVFSEFWPADFKVDESNLRLHCVLVVNLFRLDARPLAINAHQSDYRLLPLRNDDLGIEIFAVEQVVGSFAEEAPHYTPFRHFQHRGGMMQHNRPACWYHTRMKRGPSGRMKTTLMSPTVQK